VGVALLVPIKSDTRPPLVGFCLVRAHAGAAGPACFRCVAHGFRRTVHATASPWPHPRVQLLGEQCGMPDARSLASHSQLPTQQLLLSPSPSPLLPETAVTGSPCRHCFTGKTAVRSPTRAAISFACIQSEYVLSSKHSTASVSRGYNSTRSIQCQKLSYS